MYEEIGKKLMKSSGSKKEPESPDFSKAIKRLRLDAELSLENLSEITGVNKQTLHSIENQSIKNPSFGNLEKIAAGLNTSLHELILMARGEFRGNLYKTTANDRWMVNFETEKGFTIHAYSPPESSQRDFFVGVLNIKGGKKLRYWQFKTRAKACIQPWDGEILFIYHGTNWRREETVLANETLYFDASIPHTFENLSEKTSRVLLVTYPSIF